ncbi:MAG: hypothetical protein LBG72_03495 [Spirochaetaceae bacterium]|nr:hypothetical protein [Spirochaetaceae bacterium]
MKTKKTIIAAMLPALLCFACKTDVSNPAPAKPASNPALSALYFSDGNIPEEPAGKKRGTEAPKSILPLLDMNGTPVEFKPETTSYKVILPNPAPKVRITGVAESGYKVEYKGDREFTPVNGAYTVVSAVGTNNLSLTYTIFYGQTDAPVLPPATLKSMLLSVGPSINIQNGQFQDSQGCTTSNGGKALAVTLPYGVNNVSVFAVGEDESFIAYNKNMPLNLNGTPAGADVTITVNAEGKSLGIYTLSFAASAGGTASALFDVIPNPGWIANGLTALNVPGAFTAAASNTDIQYIAAADDALKAAGNRLSITAVKPAAFPFSAVTYRKDGNEFDGVLTQTADGDEITITVNNGLGYADKTYKFIVKVLNGTSALDNNANITLTGMNAALKKRKADGTSGTPDFDVSETSYNLEFTSQTSMVTLTATPPTSGNVSIGWAGISAGNGTVTGDTLTITPLSGKYEPIRFTFTKAGKLPAVYTVFFVKTDKTDAKLAAGLSFAGNNITMNPAFNPNDWASAAAPYTVNVPSNVNALIPENAAGDPSTLSVNYMPLSNPQTNDTFTITTGDGDADYNTKTYYFSVNKLGQLKAALTALSVKIGTAEYISPKFAAGTFEYTATVPATETGTTAQIRWTYNNAEIAGVKYAVDAGGWTAPASGISGFDLTGLTAGTTKLIRIKVRTTDGIEAEYRITAIHAANTANALTRLSVTKNDTTTPVALSPALNLASAYYYTATLTTETHVKVAPTAPAGGKIYISRNGGAYTELSGANFRVPETGNIAAGIPQVVSLQVRPQDSGAVWVTYTLVVRKGVTISLAPDAQSRFFPPFDMAKEAYIMGGAAAKITPTVTGGASLSYKIDSGSVTNYTSGDINLSALAANREHTIKIVVTPQDATQQVRTYTIVTAAHPYECAYTNSAPNTWTAPLAGNYQFELWGAEGGRGVNRDKPPYLVDSSTGKGGYIKAKRQLTAGTTFYLYAGQKGNDAPFVNAGKPTAGGAAVYGGGGNGGIGYNGFPGGGSGGGASFVSTVSNTSTAAGGAISAAGVRSGFQLAAGGGGGGCVNYAGGRGSGTGTAGDGYKSNGSPPVIYTSGASSSIGTANGIGETGRNSVNTLSWGAEGGGGGGGGYKGGAVYKLTGMRSNAGGGGGNGYINTIAGWTLLDTDRAGNLDSGAFKNIPEPNGAQAAGHSGAGFIRITYIGR